MNWNQPHHWFWHFPYQFCSITIFTRMPHHHHHLWRQSCRRSCWPLYPRRLDRRSGQVQWISFTRPRFLESLFKLSFNVTTLVIIQTIILNVRILRLGFENQLCLFLRLTHIFIYNCVTCNVQAPVALVLPDIFSI